MNKRELGTVKIIGAVDDYVLATNVEMHNARELVIKHKNELDAEQLVEPIDASWTSNSGSKREFDFKSLSWK